MSLAFTNHQLLLLISLFFYIVEMGFYVAIRIQVKRLDASGGLVEEIKGLVSRVRGKEIMFFSAIYVGLLFLAKFYIGVFFVILGLQALSLLVDILLWLTLFGKK